MHLKIIMAHKAENVATYILGIADSNESEISNLKLQKLLYYAQGFHLAIFDKPLFEDNIEAWTHGPVIPNIYHKYKSCGSVPIEKTECPTVELNKEEDDLLREVYDVFGQFSAWKLRDMTHDEAPWIEKEATAGIISHEQLKRHFATRVN